MRSEKVNDEDKLFVTITSAHDAKLTPQTSPSMSVPQFLRSLLSAETMLSGAEMVKKTIDGRHTAAPDRPGAAATEKDGQLISSFIPPSFLMLQAQAEEITRHPVLRSSKNKITITRVHTSQSSKPKTPPDPSSLFEKFKQKSQDSLLSEKSLSYRGPFTPSRGQSSPSLPSHIGIEDISKSPLDLKDEQINRRMWDRMREKAIKEEEERTKRKDI